MSQPKPCPGGFFNYRRVANDDKSKGRCKSEGWCRCGMTAVGWGNTFSTAERGACRRLRNAHIDAARPALTGIDQ